MRVPPVSAVQYPPNVYPARTGSNGGRAYAVSVTCSQA